jgi:hypothetical protein
MSYRYKHVELALAENFGVQPEDMPAFRARMVHLRKLGVPKTERPGSGRQIVYERSHAMQILLALEFEFLGFSPKMAAGMSVASVNGLLFAQASEAVSKGMPLFLRVKPNSIASNDPAAVFWGSPGDPPASSDMHRGAFVDIARSVKRLDASLERLSGADSLPDFDTLFPSASRNRVRT